MKHLIGWLLKNPNLMYRITTKRTMYVIIFQYHSNQTVTNDINKKYHFILCCVVNVTCFYT